MSTLPGLLLRHASARGGETALREKEHGIWQSITWAEYAERVRAFSLGMRELGLDGGDRVAIIGDNRPEWVIAELAAQSAGAISMGIYQDAVAEEVRHVLEASGARIVVAEDQEQVDKVLEIRDGMPWLEHIIYYDPRGMFGYKAAGLLGFPDVEALGRRAHDASPGAFEAGVEALDPDATALLGTTSGTTSRPKLAMLSHANLIAMARQWAEVDRFDADDEFVSFLPLAWIGEQMVSVSSALLAGFAVSFPEETSTVRRDLREIGPHVMVSPPRIWESLVSDVQVMIEDTTRLKRRVFDWAFGVGRRVAEARFAGEPVSRGLAFRRRLADWLALLPLRDQLGLRRIRHAYTGGAALGPDVFRFFHAIGVNLKQLYGQTEVAGIWVVHRDEDIRFQTVGTPLPRMEVRIAETGEILSRGPAVFQGYFRNEEATAQTLRDGWLHSGDAGYLDDDGHLIVIDRLDDVMLLADGTSFSPQFIENKLKFSPYISEAVVFGGDRPAVTAIIAIDFENAGQWSEKRQIAYTTYTDLSQKPEVYDLVRAHVESVNAEVPAAARITRFLLLHKELHADDAELTRTRKVRRRYIADRFDDLIAALYGRAATVSVETEITYQDGRTATMTHELRIETLAPAGVGAGG
ncbi:MAG: AMP-binding protein [Gemmatimonadota bacterium]|nr:AMP-binding protein [Gemmatimonadota bacterium]